MYVIGASVGGRLVTVKGTVLSRDGFRCPKSAKFRSNSIDAVRYLTPPST